MQLLKKDIRMDVGFWLGLYIFWVLIFQNRSFTISRTMTIEFCYLIFIAGIYYASIKYFIPKFLYKKYYISFFFILLIAISLAALLRVPLVFFMNRYVFHANHPSFNKVLINSFINIFIWVVCLLALHMLIEKIRFRKYVTVLEKEKTKTELDYLKAQFNPHFLFNSINSIYGHIDRKNYKARDMLHTFSEMLRYQLYECNSDYITIEKELNYIRNYILLQQSRKENLIVEFCSAQEVSGFLIAPLVLITFIENAFKYVSNYEEKENKVEILLRYDENVFCFTICNTTENRIEKSAVEHGGIGIVNVKRRLDLIYPNKHELNIINEPDCYKVSLKLQIK
jgi:Putative regulator of cell autolysis